MYPSEQDGLPNVTQTDVMAKVGPLIVFHVTLVTEVGLPNIGQVNMIINWAVHY